MGDDRLTAAGGCGPEDLRRLALSLDGTVEAPHFDRMAFKAGRIFATLAADGRSANLKFTPDQQEFRCLMAPETFAAVPNAWGRQGWTRVSLAEISPHELADALQSAWGNAVTKKTRHR